MAAVRAAFWDIETRLGPIRNIVHTAAVVKDATIHTISEAAFEQVLRPKVQGAWNLHYVSEELKLTLESFVLLSSIRYVYIARQPSLFMVLKPPLSVYRLEILVKLPMSQATPSWIRSLRIATIAAYLAYHCSWVLGNQGLLSILIIQGVWCPPSATRMVYH